MHGIVADTVKAAGTSVAICLVVGPVMIPLLRRLRAGQSIRDDGPNATWLRPGPPPWGVL